MHKTVSTMRILLADGEFGGLNPTLSLDRFIFFPVKRGTKFIMDVSMKEKTLRI